MNTDKAIKRSKRAYTRKNRSKHGLDRNHLAKRLQERTASLKASKEVIKSYSSKIKNIQYILSMGLDHASTIKMIKQVVSNG
jgi:hypothetical protein